MPGSVAVKLQAEREGLDRVFTEAGFDWRGAGCSMCLGMNPDILSPGERSASTSNRNFEGRQGKGGRTHLVSPAVAAATAVLGRFGTPDELPRPGGGVTVEPIAVIDGTAVPLDRSDVDTDQIIPAQYLKRIERSGFGPFLFDEWRKDPGFVLNDPRYEGASILIAGANFGSGSSREHAPWALEDYGFRAVIAPSFADIFRNNCFKVGMLPVELRAESVRALMDAVLDDPTTRIVVDLPERVVRAPGLDESFDIDEFTHWRLTRRSRRHRAVAAQRGEDQRVRGDASGLAPDRLKAPTAVARQLRAGRAGLPDDVGTPQPQHVGRAELQSRRSK